ncbi:MAG: hypothetical protein QM779_11015 [Propionicimonas sp.]|uniref:hypothetical protein n=1 Tax=Propionicimonas sp. TaxID=1955623 RepID=UPI003D13F719
MTEQPRAELSEVDRLDGDVDNLDAAPDAEHANQTEDGAPKNYGPDDPDENLPEQ